MKRVTNPVLTRGGVRGQVGRNEVAWIVGPSQVGKGGK